MTQTQTTNNGILPKEYRTKSPDRGSIQDHPERRYIELYPAGFTKPDKKFNRQHYYQLLYKIAEANEVNSDIYPFKYDSHRISLTHTPCSQDKFAISITLSFSPSKLEKLIQKDITNLQDYKDYLSWCNLGYVPKQISSCVYKNLQRFGKGKILKIRKSIFGKYHGAKIVIPYDGREFIDVIDPTLNRFIDILF